MKIGIMDSGIGGLTVLYEARKLLPQEAYYYYADTDHVPYGEKTAEEIRSYADTAVAFLCGLGCDCVVIACNTATAVAAAYLRNKYDIPVIGIEPAVKPAVERGEGKRILVIATPLTAAEKKLHDLILKVDEEGIVDVLALPGLVHFAERGEFDSEAVRKYLKDSLGQDTAEIYGTLVFGCTHFNHFRPVLRSLLGPKINMIDGSEGTARNMKRILEEKGLSSEKSPSIRYYVSGRELTDETKLAFYRDVLKHLSLCRETDV